MKKYICTEILLVIVTILSTMYVSSLPEVDIPNVDKPVHFLMYATLTMAIFIDYTRLFKEKGSRWIYLIAPVFSIAYGGLMELVQALLPWRGCSIWDFLANAIGAAMAVVVFLIIRIMKATRNPRP